MADDPLHFLHVFSTFDAGGPQVRTAKILELLLPQHRHTVIAMDGRTGCRERVPSSVQLELHQAPAARGSLAMGRAMAAELRALQPDALLTYNFGAVESLLGAWLARYDRVVHHEEGFGPEEVDRLFRRRNYLRRALLWRARAVVVPSKNLERLAASAWRQPPARVLYLPNGVDLARFAPSDRPRVGGSRVTVGCVASFRAVKNQALLLRAFAAMERRDDVQLRLVGDGPDLEPCRQLATELGIADRTVFAGHADDTASAYHDMDVFVICSRTEQMPIALLEAMASGLPVVSTDVGDVRDMLAPANGELVVPRDDPAALAAALDRIVTDVQLRRMLGDANRRKCAQEFEEHRCLARYARLYEGVARG